jgi:hypothetical protein
MRNEQKARMVSLMQQQKMRGPVFRIEPGLVPARAGGLRYAAGQSRQEIDRQRKLNAAFQ